MTLEERVARLEAKFDLVEEMREDIKAMRSTLDEMKGGKRAMMVLFSTAGVLLGAIATYIRDYWHHIAH